MTGEIIESNAEYANRRFTLLREPRILSSLRLLLAQLNTNVLRLHSALDENCASPDTHGSHYVLQLGVGTVSGMGAMRRNE